MENFSKSLVRVLWLVLGLVIILSVAAFVVWPLFGGNRMEFYIRLFLFMVAVQTFALLRLFNAIVQNTRFTLKTREAIVVLTQNFPNLMRAVRGVQQVLGVHKSTLDSANHSMKELDVNLQRLLEAYNEVRSNKRAKTTEK